MEMDCVTFIRIEQLVYLDEERNGEDELEKKINGVDWG